MRAPPERLPSRWRARYDDMMEFWCELASTYTYLAAMRVDAVAAAAGVEVTWRPFTLHPIFRASGWNDSPFVVYPAKGRYMWRDMEREAARLELPFRRPTVFPRNSVPAAKVAILGMDRGWGAAFARGMLRANFVDDADIAAPEVIDGVLASVGVDGRAAREEAASPDHAPRLRKATEEAIARGLFGAPTFMVGEEMFWGNDRLEAAVAWARRR